jgi:hypothetical protein
MKMPKRPPNRFYILLALAGLLVLYLRPAIVAAMPLTDQDRLERAWRYAGEVGSFEYRTDVVQTTHPTARLDNAGRHPSTKRFSVAGTMNQPAKTMEIKLWSPGSSQDGIECF